jgi:hypothetical protein
MAISSLVAIALITDFTMWMDSRFQDCCRRTSSRRSNLIYFLGWRPICDHTKATIASTPPEIKTRSQTPKTANIIATIYRVLSDTPRNSTPTQATIPARTIEIIADTFGESSLDVRCSGDFELIDVK